MPDVPATIPGSLPAMDNDMLRKMQEAAARHAPQLAPADMLTPRLVLLQSTSGYLKRDTKNYLDDAREGDFIDTLSLKPRKSLRLVIAFVQNQYTEWKPNQGPFVKSHGTDATAYNAASGGWGAHIASDGNVIIPSYRYYALVLADDYSKAMPCLFDLQGTQMARGRRLNSLLQADELPSPDGGTFIAPPYSRVYEVSTVRDSNTQGSWMSWVFKQEQMTLMVPNGESFYARAMRLAEDVIQGRIQAAPEPDHTREPRDVGSQSAEPTQANEPPPHSSDDDIPF